MFMMWPSQRRSRTSADCSLIRRLGFGVVYWYVWTVLIPRVKGYRLEEEKSILSDGTSINRLVKVKD